MKFKKVKLSVLLLLGFGSLVLQAQTTGTFTDSRDGYVYKTVTIGTQVWMAENLAYKPASGNYWAYDDDTSNVAVYGYLYDWNTAIKACPTGWHLPTYDEWNELAGRYIGAVPIKDLKEAGTSHWDSPNTEATNKTGFTALPGGITGTGKFGGIGSVGAWWTATEYDADSFEVMQINDKNRIFNDAFDKKIGFSVRCIKD